MRDRLRDAVVTVGYSVLRGLGMGAAYGGVSGVALVVWLAVVAQSSYAAALWSIGLLVGAVMGAGAGAVIGLACGLAAVLTRSTVVATAAVWVTAAAIAVWPGPAGDVGPPEERLTEEWTLLLAGAFALMIAFEGRRHTARVLDRARRPPGWSRARAEARRRERAAELARFSDVRPGD